MLDFRCERAQGSIQTNCWRFERTNGGRTCLLQLESPIVLRWNGCSGLIRDVPRTTGAAKRSDQGLQAITRAQRRSYPEVEEDMQRLDSRQHAGQRQIDNPRSPRHPRSIYGFI